MSRPTTPTASPIALSPRAAAAALVLAVAFSSCGDDGTNQLDSSPTTAATASPPNTAAAITTPQEPIMTDNSTPPTSDREATESDFPPDPYADLALHAGYWRSENGPSLAAYDGRALQFHNVHHVDVPARRITVYAQARVFENTDGTGEEVVISPPQLDAGTCGPDPLTGQTVCAHANAVYLNGSGEEAATADGTGAWWVKHSWILDGEGYNNCQLMPPPTEVYDYDADCIPVIGQWLDDQLTMRVGPVTPNGEIAEIHNERRLLLDRDPAIYQIARVDPRSDGTEFTVELRCTQDARSPLDGSVIGCPPASGGSR